MNTVQGKQKTTQLEKFLNEITWKHFQKLPEKGEVIIAPSNPKRVGDLVVRSYNDPETGQLMNFVDSQGRERVLIINKKTTLRLDDENARLAYMFIKMHPVYTTPSGAPLKIVNVEEEATEFVIVKESGMKADVIISKLSGDDLRNFARVVFPSSKKVSVRVKIGPSVSDAVLKRYLYNIAAKDPMHIVTEWNDERRELREILRRAMDGQNPLVVEARGVFMFNGENIGLTFEQAVEWLAKNQDAIRHIK